VRWFWLDDDMMVSMRYARNLVEGYGLVFNPGERVEGYTNFGWVVIMSLVHLLPLSDQAMPAAMGVVSMFICIGVAVLAARLLAAIEPRLVAVTLPVALLLIITCTDVMLWATSGFETVLLTALHLAVVLLATTQSRADWRLFACLALIPLVRSDALVLWFGDAALVLWLSTDRRRIASLLVVTLLPVVGQFAFRWIYYGDVFPNTYYLKLTGLDDRWGRGIGYVRDFIERYALALIFAIGTAAALWRSKRAARSLVTSLVPALIYGASVGGDSFEPFRFFAHVMPEIFIWASIGAASLLHNPFGRAAWLGALAVAFALPGLIDPVRNIAGVGNNGDPFQQVVVAAELSKNSDPRASVAVFPAGIVPYFTGMYTVDLLGKVDSVIAHLDPVPGAKLGHGKFDSAYSFGKDPDYLVSARSKAYADSIAPAPGTADYVRAILSSPEFQARWQPNPVPDPFLLEYTAVYVATGSDELDDLDKWQGVTIAR
jgi:hypothetical protein